MICYRNAQRRDLRQARWDNEILRLKRRKREESMMAGQAKRNTAVMAAFTLAAIASCRSTGTQPESSNRSLTHESAAQTISSTRVAVPVTSASSDNGTKLLPLSWIDPESIPLYSHYHWTGLAPLAHAANGEKFEFEKLCNSTRAPEYAHLDNGSAVAESSLLDNHSPDDWRAQEQIIHWPGDALQTSQYASSSLRSLTQELKTCAATRAGATVAISSETPRDITAVITAPQPEGTVVLHDFFASSACGGAIAELALWTTTQPGGQPKIGWQAPGDEKVLTAITDPLCAANQGK